MNALSTSSTADPSPSVPKGSIARSRSRYKGARPSQSIASRQESPYLNKDKHKQIQEGAPAVRGRQPSNSDDPVPAATSVRPKHELPRKIVDHGESEFGVVAQPSLSGGCKPREDRRDDKFADIPRRERVTDRLESRRPSRDQPESKGRHERTQLQSRRIEEDTAPLRPPAPTKRSFTQRITGQANTSQHSKSREELKKMISGPIAVEPPQSIVTPAFDAPISAVNAGERRVTIKYGQSTMSLPVTPSTTPLDLIRLAAEQSSEPISPKTTLVLESYRQLGLERPLRRYEHIRDVLNSWDHDTQNILLITPSPSGTEEELELNCVPHIQPPDTVVSIYHSQRPGHWDKRWVTLRTDGQVLIAKKDGGETTNICHLSDFDIYTPTPRQVSKKIKPPRKICFTVKSQQKSSMFMSTVNFVHFFSTSDKVLAASWYKAIQEWRSWYLVHVMGNGKHGSPSHEAERTSYSHQGTTEVQPRPINPGRPSIGNRDHEVFEIRPSAPPVRHRGAPPLSFPKKLTADPDANDAIDRRGSASKVQSSPRRSSEPTPEPFPAASLLGRTYTQRQKAQQAREANQIPSGPQPPVPSLTSHSDGLKRASSQRQKTRPLVDLTPQYREPPQHSRKGRGVVPEHIPAGGLVEIATSPEAAIETPPATTWQRPPTRGREKGSISDMQRSRTMRRDRSTGPSTNARQTSSSPDKGEAPFTTGLLADTKNHSSNIQRAGRGVMTGDRQAKAPMLDITEPSNYAPGSFLARVERHEGSPRPVVEREKRREIDARVGEGV